MLAAAPGFSDKLPPVNELFAWRTISQFTLAGITFKITALTLIMFALTGLLALMFVGAFRNAKVVPSGLQNLMEMAVGAVRENVVEPVLGSHGEPWLPFL